MAKNLRQKVPKEDQLYVNDVNKNALHKFIDELSGYNVSIIESAKEVAQLSVC